MRIPVQIPSRCGYRDLWKQPQSDSGNYQERAAEVLSKHPPTSRSMLRYRIFGTGMLSYFR